MNILHMHTFFIFTGFKPCCCDFLDLSGNCWLPFISTQSTNHKQTLGSEICHDLALIQPLAKKNPWNHQSWRIFIQLFFNFVEKKQVTDMTQN